MQPQQRQRHGHELHVHRNHAAATGNSAWLPEAGAGIADPGRCGLIRDELSNGFHDSNSAEGVAG